MTVEKRQRALKRTLFWGLAFSIPLSILLYYRFTYGSMAKQQNFGEVKPFFLKRANATGLSKHHLRQGTSLLVLLPFSSPTFSAQGAAKLEEIAAWAAEKLQTHEKSERSYQLYILGKEEIVAPPKWQAVTIEEEEDLAAFLPDSYPLSKPTLVLVDQNTKIRGIYDLQTVSLSQLTTSWSKMTFNHFLDDYLSKRTFFGPKRS